MLSSLNKNQLGNKAIYKCSSEHLTMLNLKIPNEQRIRDTDKVADIVNYQLDNKQIKKTFNFLGVINIHHLLSDDEYYLVDGQHRYEAIKQLYITHKQRDIEVMIEVISVNTLEELIQNYKLINKNTPLPDFSEMIDKEIPEKAALHFKEIYPKAWSMSTRPKRPHVNFNHFQESLGFLVENIPEIDSSQKLIGIVEEHNTNLSHWPYEEFSHLSEEQHNKSVNMKFYLGCSKHVSNEWGYEWVREIIEVKTGKKLKSHKKKKTIPKSLRTNVWNKYIGKEKGEVLCVCCMERCIQQAEFQAGHIISEANGGKTNSDNILPICGSCNNSMKTMHMRSYIEQHYEHNLIFFEKKKYFTPFEWEEHKRNLNPVVKKEKPSGFMSIFKKKS